MASLIPVIKDILPIIHPGPVISVKSNELDDSTGQTQGMIRKGAIVGKCDKLCASGTYIYLRLGCFILSMFSYFLVDFNHKTLEESSAASMPVVKTSGSVYSFAWVALL